MALLNATKAAARMGVSRRALGRKAAHLEASGNAVRVGHRLLFESRGLEAAYAAVTEMQAGNAEQLEQLEQLARQEVEADAAVGEIPPYATSRARREHYAALLAQRQVEAFEGTLVSASEIDKLLFETHRMARDQLQIMPTRVAAELYAQKSSADIAIILEREVHRTLTDLCDAVARGLARVVRSSTDG